MDLAGIDAVKKTIEAKRSYSADFIDSKPASRAHSTSTPVTEKIYSEEIISKKAHHESIRVEVKKAETSSAIKFLRSTLTSIQIYKRNEDFFDVSHTHKSVRIEGIRNQDKPELRWKNFVWVVKIFNQYFFYPFIWWVLWIVTGTVYYTLGSDEFGWELGFYMAVNVGYSIGWGYPLDATLQSEWFSTFYLLAGALLGTYAAGCFLVMVTATSREWDVVVEENDTPPSSPGGSETNDTIQLPGWKQVLTYVRIHYVQLVSIAVFILWIFMMQMWATFSIPKWNFIDGLYFAVSSCSTGGLWSIPDDSPGDKFVIVGFFTLFGVPIMGVAFASIIDLLFDVGNARLIMKSLVEEPVKEEEIHVLQKIGVDNKEGFLYKTEFIVLCGMRLSILTPSIIDHLVTRFDQLDENKKGKLCYAMAFKRYNSMVPDLVEALSNGEDGGASTAAPSRQASRAPSRTVSKIGGSFQDYKKRKDVFHIPATPQKEASTQAMKGNSNKMGNILFDAFWLIKYWRPYYRIPFIIWVIFLLVGTTFYAVYDDFGWDLGFYMAVNVGYSIGWGYPLDPSQGSEWFSTFYLFTGAALCVYIIGCVLEIESNNSREWDLSIKLGDEIKKSTQAMFKSPLLRQIVTYIRVHLFRVGSIFLYVVWLFVFQIWGTFVIPGWSFIDGMYLSAASLSGGGMWAIPVDSPKPYFAAVGAFSCIGIPIMAVAFVSTIGLVFDLDNPRGLLVQMASARVTETEIELLQRCGIDSNDGFFDKCEYIILVGMRLNILTPSVIQYIVQRFNQLDETGTGRLCYATAFKRYHNLVPEMLKRDETKRLISMNKIPSESDFSSHIIIPDSDHNSYGPSSRKYNQMMDSTLYEEKQNYNCDEGDEDDSNLQFGIGSHSLKLDYPHNKSTRDDYNNMENSYGDDFADRVSFHEAVSRNLVLSGDYSYSLPAATTVPDDVDIEAAVKNGH